MHQVPSSSTDFDGDVGRIFVQSHLGRFGSLQVPFQASSHCGLPQGNDVRECLAVRLRSYACLRLVCREWSTKIDSILFRNIPLAFNSASSLLLSLSLLKRHRDHVQSIHYSNQIQTSHRDAKEIIGPLNSFFQSCPNLNTLLVHSPYYNLDKTHTQIFHGVVPHIQVLHVEHSCCSFSGKPLQWFLQEVGVNLRQLEVKCWKEDPYYGEGLGHIPRRFPYLHTLALVGVDVRFNDIDKLFSRIRSKTSEKQADGKVKVIVSCPLRRVTLRQVVDLGEREFSSLVVQPRVGFRLTALHLELAGENQISTTLIIMALKACPNLNEFTYDSPVPKTVFKHLPRTLEKLRIMIFPLRVVRNLNLVNTRAFVTTSHDIKCGIEENPAPALRHLTVSCLEDLHGEMATVQEEVQMTCIWKGIEVAWVWHYPARDVLYVV